ncbi:RluA family pseudouridine synthase [Aerococcaceae bacterium DSM 111021]|nr:RluA family pseudouridine synthase [Aerococcaceae bacterium DSM 111021]
MILTWEYRDNVEQTIKRFLHFEGIPRNFVKAVKFNGGKILLNQKEVTVRAKLNRGDILKLIAPDEIGHDTVAPSNVSIDVVYEDEDLLIVNKPSESVSIPSKQNPDSSMANRIKGYYVDNNYKDQVIHIVTRLDRDTTGLMLIAKHRLAHAYMDRLIQSKGITKIYYALSHKVDWAQHGYIEDPIGRNPESIISRIVDVNGQAALTEYWVEDRVDQASLLRIQLHTGRTHQIRVHLSHHGGPLVGDDLYGGVKDSDLSRQALHCGELQFEHPFTGEQIHIKQPIPEDMQGWLNIRKGE